MTVAELIDELQQYDQTTTVAVHTATGVMDEVMRVYEDDVPRFGGRKEYVVIE